MTLVAVCSAGGSAASTTTAVVLASMLPAGYPTLLAECDPTGGDVAAWAQLSSSPGWSSAVSGGDRSWDAIGDHAQQLPSGLRVMAAPPRAAQAYTAVGEAARGFAGLLAAAPDVVTVADCGRVEFDAPVWAAPAQLTLLLVRQSVVSAPATVPRGRSGDRGAWRAPQHVSAGGRRAHRWRSVPRLARSPPLSAPSCSACFPRMLPGRHWSPEDGPSASERHEVRSPGPRRASARRVIESLYGRDHRPELLWGEEVAS